MQQEFARAIVKEEKNRDLAINLPKVDTNVEVATAKKGILKWQCVDKRMRTMSCMFNNM